MGFMTPDIDMPAATSVEAPKPIPARRDPIGARPKRKSMQQTFLGDNATPEPGAFAGKTLLGQ